MTQQAVEFYGSEFAITEADILRIVSESDFVSDKDGEKWVELTDRRPGDLENYPHIVYCSQSNERGSVARRDYRPIS